MHKIKVCGFCFERFFSILILFHFWEGNRVTFYSSSDLYGIYVLLRLVGFSGKHLRQVLAVGLEPTCFILIFDLRSSHIYDPIPAFSGRIIGQLL